MKPWNETYNKLVTLGASLVAKKPEIIEGIRTLFYSILNKKENLAHSIIFGFIVAKLVLAGKDYPE